MPARSREQVSSLTRAFEQLPAQIATAVAKGVPAAVRAHDESEALRIKELHDASHHSPILWKIENSRNLAELGDACQAGIITRVRTI